MTNSSFFKSPLNTVIQGQYIEHCQRQLVNKRHYLELAKNEFQKSTQLIETIQQKIAEKEKQLESIEQFLKTNHQAENEYEEHKDSRENLLTEKEKTIIYIEHNTQKLAPYLEKMIQLNRDIENLETDVLKMAEQVAEIQLGR